jgi:hypothetical protein
VASGDGDQEILGWGPGGVLNNACENPITQNLFFYLLTYLDRLKFPIFDNFPFFPFSPFFNVDLVTIFT